MYTRPELRTAVKKGRDPGPPIGLTAAQAPSFPARIARHWLHAEHNSMMIWKDNTNRVQPLWESRRGHACDLFHPGHDVICLAVDDLIRPAHASLQQGLTVCASLQPCLSTLKGADTSTTRETHPSSFSSLMTSFRRTTLMVLMPCFFASEMTSFPKTLMTSASNFKISKNVRMPGMIMHVRDTKV